MPSDTEAQLGTSIIVLRSGLICLGTSGLTGIIMLIDRDPFVPGDVFPFISWSFFFALGLALVSPSVTRILFELPEILRYGVAVMLGGLAGLLFPLLLYSTILNPYYGTFSIPVGLAWAAGGASGLIGIASTSLWSHKTGAFVQVLVIGVLCLGAGFLSDELVAKITSARRVEIVWIRWRPGDDRVVLDSRLEDFLSKTELARLQKLGLNGYLEWEGERIDGVNAVSIPTSRAIIVMQNQIVDPVDLPLPADDDIALIHIQERNGWRMDPPGAPGSDQTLHLEVNPSHPSQTMASVKVPGGEEKYRAIDWNVP